MSFLSATLMHLQSGVPMCVFVMCVWMCVLRGRVLESPGFTAVRVGILWSVHVWMESWVQSWFSILRDTLVN